MPKNKIQKKELLETMTIFKRSLIFQTKEFFQNSTLHGVRYIAETGRPVGEKFMWFCFTSIGAVTALVIIMSLWEKFQTNPTITGLDTDFHNQNVVFPTIVICPNTSFDSEKVLEYLSKFSKANEENADTIISFLERLTTLTFDDMEELYNLIKRIKEEDGTVFNLMTLRELALSVGIDCENVVTNCKYRDESMTCCTEFEQVYTEHGFCYAFNSRFKSLSNVDESTGSPHDLYETDKKWALSFHHNSTANVFLFSHEEYFGSDFSAQIELEQGQYAVARISKKNTYTTDDARQLTVGQRKCIFHDEMKLKYFPDDYTFSSCMKECRLKKAYKLCKCNPPFYKPIPSMRSCGIDDFSCLYKHRHNITNIRDCLHCELSCSKTVFNIEKLTREKEGEGTWPGVVVEFLTWPIIRYKREVLFGWVDLLVSFGGIASLFLGFSLLSGVEIIYYFTLRACCMVYRNRQELYEIEERIKRQPPPPIDLSLKPKLKSKFSAKFSDEESDPGIRNNLNNTRKSSKPTKLLLNVPTQGNTNEYGRRRRTGKDYFNYAKSMYKSPKVIPQYPEKDAWEYGQYLP